MFWTQPALIKISASPHSSQIMWLFTRQRSSYSSPLACFKARENYRLFPVLWSVHWLVPLQLCTEGQVLLWFYFAVMNSSYRPFWLGSDHIHLVWNNWLSKNWQSTIYAIFNLFNLCNLCFMPTDLIMLYLLWCYVFLALLCHF